MVGSGGAHIPYRWNCIKVKNVVTNMPSVWYAAVAYLFGSIAVQSATANGYPYLKKLDSTRPETWFGICYGVSKIAQALALVISSLLTNYFNKYRPQLIVGRVLSILGLIGYAAAGAFPVEIMRWIVPSSFFLLGAAEGTQVIFRGYAPRFSSIADRTRCMAIMTTAGLGGILFGPLVNLVFAQVGELPVFHFLAIDWDMFTLPVLPLLLSNIVSLVGVYFMSEPSPPEKRANRRQASNPICRAWHWTKGIAAGIDILLFLTLIAMKIISSGGFFAILTSMPQHLAAVSNESKPYQVSMFSVGQIVSGLMSAGFSVAYTVLKLGTMKFFHPTLSLIYSLVLFSCFAIITAPFSSAIPLVLRDPITAPHGCDLTVFTWCGDTKLISMSIWLPFACVFIGIAFPLALISQDFLFSRVLEKSRRADLFQGLYGLVECFTLTYVPWKASGLYAEMGPFLLYSYVAGAMLLACFLYAFIIPRFRDLLETDEDKTTCSDVRDVTWRYSKTIEAKEVEMLAVEH